MTKNDLYREIKSDLDFLTGMVSGIRKKYRRELNNKRIADGTFLGKSEYTTPRHNRITVLWNKSSIGGIQDMSYQVFWKYSTDEGNNLITPKFDEFGDLLSVDIFTAHSQKRSVQRLGITVIDMFKNTNCNTFKVQDTFKPEQFLAPYGDEHICVFVEHKWGWLCKTIVSSNLLYENQVADLNNALDGRRLLREYYDDVYVSGITPFIKSIYKRA
jgi:hypothetical protein